MRVAEILAQLPALSAEDIAKIRACITALSSAAVRSSGRDDKLRFDVGNDWLLDGIVRELRARGQGALIPKGFAITKVRSFHNYALHSDKVRAWLLSVVHRNLSKNERAYVGYLAAGCLADLIERWDHPVTLHIMLNNASRIPEAIMRQFPGYVEAGLMSWILKGGKGNGQRIGE